MYQNRAMSLNDRKFLRESQCGYTNGQPLVCCTTQRQTRSFVLPASQKKECGDTRLDFRIIGGNVTQVGEYPWTVLLEFDNIYQCSGSLITRNHVVTAAHCIPEDGTRYGFYLILKFIYCLMY